MASIETASKNDVPLEKEAEVKALLAKLNVHELWSGCTVTPQLLVNVRASLASLGVGEAARVMLSVLTLKQTQRIPALQAEIDLFVAACAGSEH